MADNNSAPAATRHPVSAPHRFVALAVALGWYYKLFALSTAWQSKLNLLSAVAILPLCWCSGGLPRVVLELKGVASDVARPFDVACRAPYASSREMWQQLLATLTAVTSYTFAYGPFSSVVLVAFALPGDTLLQLAELSPKLVHLGWLGLAGACGLLVAWPAFHVMYQLSISVLLHRYFSHRAFEASRPATLIFGFWSCLSIQRGPLWWASIHRRHHKTCDKDDDPHSPITGGLLRSRFCRFMHSHIGWTTERCNMAIRTEYMTDWLQRSPELLLVDLFFVDIAAFITSSWELLFSSIERASLRARSPQWALAGLMLRHARILGLATAWHTTFAVNSLCHGPDVVPDKAGCHSQNVPWLVLASCGETNHVDHHGPNSRSARQAPPERYDLGMGLIRALEAAGVVSKVKAD